MRDAFSLQTFHTIFQQKYEHISDITFDIKLNNDGVHFKQPGLEC